LFAVHKRLQPLIIKNCPFKEAPADVKKASWVQPELVCGVRFNEWTSDKKLRAPVFQGLSDDIDPKQCRLEDSLPVHVPPSTLRLPSAEGKEHSAPTVSSDARIDFTNLRKVFWPEEGYTKGDLIKYYDKVSSYLIPHLLDRPLVFERFPNGIYGESF